MGAARGTRRTGGQRGTNLHEPTAHPLLYWRAQRWRRIEGRRRLRRVTEASDHEHHVLLGMVVVVQVRKAAVGPAPPVVQPRAEWLVRFHPKEAAHPLRLEKV